MSVYVAMSSQRVKSLDEEQEDECMKQPADVPSKQARVAVEILRIFLERTGDVPDSVFSSIISIEDIINMQEAITLKQKKTTDFFAICRLE
ncbi:hypothetical protein HHI36_016721 [Cryptolaemus montrouzieri]|uniref:Uncharacterized protein n=1 Tax=Cryptolaemus montrouzieri TaxID=559131 RepID=A0ABD2NKM7_9CUCU